ncbi:hypothetical protein [Methylomonas paludis]|uniref:hypothetical protein n=1 Tax=Methylomonas paludis TaxID=1173101 RepID=UPI001FEB28DC|nr:hypothetical protein [Methylomonas paludis]
MPHFIQHWLNSIHDAMERFQGLHLPAWLTHPAVQKLVKILIYTLLTLILLISILLCFALDNSPQDIILQGMNRDDIQRAKLLLHVTPEERESLKTVRLNQKDLNIAASYLLNHFVENTIQIQFTNDRLLFQMAIFVPDNPWGRFLDFHFSLKQNGEDILLKSFKIGEISIPDRAANLLLPFIVHHTALNEYWLAITRYVKTVRINQNDIEVSYLGSIIDTAKKLAIQKHQDYPNLHIYQQLINEIVAQHDPAWRLSLTELLQPLFLSAYQHSTPDTAIQDNRAVIIAVASYIYKNELRRYLPLGLIYSHEYQVYAYRRIDIPQHFIAEALITAVDSNLLSLQLGLDKEVGDAQKGSGFSFIDISSDRTGIRFGQLAIASPASARRVQQIMAETRDYTAIIPDIEGLPEHMDEATFKEKYRNIDSQAYQDMIKLIDSRITALPLYQLN